MHFEGVPQLTKIANHMQLAYCVVQFLEKDPSLTEAVCWGSQMHGRLDG